jgi:hypothetical protein
MTMGAFCVFGVSRQVCRKLAEKNIPTYDSELKRSLTAPEWGVRVAAAGDRMFEESVKQVRISPELDAPQFCRDWIAASPADVKLTRVMYRGAKIDKHGAVVLKDGAPVLTWLPYDEAKPAARPFGEPAHLEAA